jgi:hypothetical protein
MLDNYIKFFKVHERALIVFALLGVTLIGINKYFDRASKETDARLQAAQATLAAQKEADDKLATQNQAAQAQYQVLIGQVNAQNARLSGEILQLSQSLAARQKQDAALPLPELATRWETILSLPPSTITSTENGLNVSSDGARATVSSLESLPVLKQQLADETTVADNRARGVDSAQSLVVGLNQQVSGLNLQLVDSGKACDARVAAVKKSRWKWFKWGFVSGFLSGAYVGHKIP